MAKKIVLFDVEVEIPDQPRFLISGDFISDEGAPFNLRAIPGVESSYCSRVFESACCIAIVHFEDKATELLKHAQMERLPDGWFRSQHRAMAEQQAQNWRRVLAAATSPAALGGGAK